MKRFYRIFVLTLLTVFLGLFSVAQGIPSGFVQTTWTVPGIANWSFSTSWTNLSSSPQLGLLNGVSTFPITTTGQVSLGGYGVTLLADTAQIVPTPSTWTFQFTCPAGYIGGFSLQVAVTGGGGTQDISTQVAAAEPPNNVCTPSGGGGGSGGLTTFTTGNLPPLFTSTLGPDPTHNPALRFTQDTAANSTFFGNFSGVTANPDFWNLVAGTNISFGINTGTKTLTINSVSNLMIQHANSSTGILQTLMNWQDTPANLSGGSLDSGYQPVVFKTDTAGGWAAETLATFSLAPYSTPPIAGQRAIAYPTGFSTTCATGSNTTGKTVVTNGGCNAMVTWTFSAPGGNITTTSGATIPIANVTAVYPFVTSTATIQSGNATPSNFFETTCTGTGVTLDVTQQGVQSGTLNFPLHQYTSSTSLTVSLANYNAMTCDISATEIDGSVGTPNIVNGQATLTAAYIYYTGPPVSSPNQYYVQGPLNFDTTTDTLSLPLPYDVAFDFGVSGTTYAIQNSNFTSAVAGLKTTFCAANANTSTAPTLNMNGWGAWTIFGPTGGALSLNDITPCAGASGTGQMINVQLTQTAAGMQWWLQNPKTGSGSAITGSGTANTLTKWTAANTIGNSSVTDDGTTPTRIPDSIDTNAIYREYTVDTGGVTGGQALCVTGNLDGGGQPKVLACPTTGHGAGFVGIAYQNALAGGLALACWSVGCSALFDGSVTQRDTAIVSTTTAGDLHDTGVTTAPGGENLVVNIAGPNSGAGTRALINITGATPAGGGGGGLPSGVLGQVPTNSGASAGSYLAQSPTVGVANGGAAITTSYTLLCDSATVSVGIQDRGKWAVVGSGGSVTIPDLAGTGCSGFYGGVQNSTSGAVTVSRQTSDTFNVYGPTQGAPTTGQTSFSLPAGSWATFNPSTTATVYDVRIGTPPASSGSGLSGMTAGQVPIAATATTVTSSKALAGTGAGITTGPTTATLNDCVKFGDTAGTLADAGAACGSGSGSGYTNLTGSTTETTVAAINSACGTGTFYATTPLSIATGGTVTCPVQFIGAGIWTIATGQTVTFSKSVAETDGPNQIFAGAGTILFGAGTPIDYAEWFGAKGDGTTDDSAAIQAAINAEGGNQNSAGTNAWGGTQLLAKVYVANTGLIISTSQYFLQGVAQGGTPGGTFNGYSTVLQTTSATVNQISVVGPSTTNSNWISGNRVEYISFRRTVAPTGTAATLLLENSEGAIIQHNVMLDAQRMIYSYNTSSGGNGAIEDNKMVWTGVTPCGAHAGIYLDETAGIFPSIRLRNNTVSEVTTCASSYGMYINGNPQDIHVMHLETATTGYGVYINGAGGSGTHTDNHFQDDVLDQCQVSCYYITGIVNGSTAQASVSIQGGWADGNSSTAPVVDIEGSSGIIVNGVTIYNNQQPGYELKVNGGFGNIVTSNNFLNLGASGTSIWLNSTAGNVVSNNQLASALNSSTTGIKITSATRNYLTGNSFTDVMTTGISLDSASSNNDFLNLNELNPSNVTTPVSNAGASNQIGVGNTTNLGLQGITWSGCTFSNGVCTVTGSASTSITISSIPGTYSSLVLKFNGNSTTTTNIIGVQFNGDLTAGHYSWGCGQVMNQTSSGCSNSTSDTSIANAFLTGATGTGDVASGTLTIEGYSGTTFAKQTETFGSYFEASGPTNGSYEVSGHWTSTAAITSITLICHNCAVGSTFALYGMN